MALFPEMPMAAKAAEYGDNEEVMPDIRGGRARPPAFVPPPPQPMPEEPMEEPMDEGPMDLTGQGGLPSPDEPTAPPWDIKLQADGSSVYYIKSPDGDPANDIILGRNEPPKLPKGMQEGM